MRAATLSLALVAIALPAGAQESLVITNVNVIPMTSDTVLHSRNLVIVDGSVAEISEGPVDPEIETRIIDGADGYLIPGLWDMHVHIFQGGDQLSTLEQLVYHGVLGVRDMNGVASLDSIAHLRQQIATGHVTGPYIVAPGPLIDAPGREANELSPAIREVSNRTEVRAVVNELAQEGAPFFKTYNRMTEELLAALFDEADRLGIPVAGHVPMPVAASKLSSLGMASQEHLQGIIEEASDAGDEFREFAGTELQGELTQEIIRRFVSLRTRMVQEYSEERANDIFAEFHENGTAITPTLVSNRGVLLGGLSDELTGDPRFAALDVSVRMTWEQPNLVYALFEPEMRYSWMALLKRIVSSLDDHNVMLLAGTDLGVPWTYAGSSLHDELALMVDAGLSPYSALLTATRNAAEFLHLDDRGTIDIGTIADLVLLDTNPLDDIEAVRSVRLVIQGGSPVQTAAYPGR